MARAFDDPTDSYSWGPNTALTPKLVAHGSQANFRILKGNPVGFAMEYGEGGYLHPYLSARMENHGEPLHNVILDEMHVDQYGIGMDAPLMRPPGQRRYLIPDSRSIFRWPDTSVQGGYRDPDILAEQKGEPVYPAPGIIAGNESGE